VAFSTCINVYVGRGNVTEIVPYSDVTEGELLDMSGAAKVEVCVGGAESDSDLLPTAIWWATDGDGVWTIYAKLGLVPAIVVGQQDLRVTVYDGDYTSGLVLTHDTQLYVIGPC